MSEPQIKLVEPKGFTINLPSIAAPVAIRTHGDEIVILMSLTLRPRDNVMDININVTASGDGAAVPGLDENATPDVSGYFRAVVHSMNDVELKESATVQQNVPTEAHATKP